MEDNYYEILEVDKDSDQQDIKKSYKNLSKKYHPDISKESNAEEMMAKINAAYDVLGDPEKRLEYDYQLDNDMYYEEYDEYYQENRASSYDYSNYYYPTSKTTCSMSWITVVVGLLFWATAFATYLFFNVSDLANIYSKIREYSLFDIFSTIVLVMLAFIFLYYLSFLFVYLIIFWLIISLSLEFNSFLLAAVTLYGGLYLSFRYAFDLDDKVEEWLGFSLILVLIFSNQIKENLILVIILGGMVFSILITIYRFWSLMEPNGSDYVEINHIWQAAIILPVIGALPMLIAYAVDNWI